LGVRGREGGGERQKKKAGAESSSCEGGGNNPGKKTGSVAFRRTAGWVPLETGGGVEGEGIGRGHWGEIKGGRRGVAEKEVPSIFVEVQDQEKEI